MDKIKVTKWVRPIPMIEYSIVYNEKIIKKLKYFMIFKLQVYQDMLMLVIYVIIN